ncbi:hypothetical protein PILCRDRAFT_819321 [Piloderma croceum F 1598]|uniref:Uncharacterized protein n=1 Tax=Piloderma croceum (strain F 1598) TaxID=765440 RepID=A0A0C3BBL9_PILCF|nr:hypothetical protein PILCRDRAFT_819321 [Piloderma croceum F 1598]
MSIDVTQYPFYRLPRRRNNTTSKRGISESVPIRRKRLLALTAVSCVTHWAQN